MIVPGACFIPFQRVASDFMAMVLCGSTDENGWYFEATPSSGTILYTALNQFETSSYPIEIQTTVPLAVEEYVGSQVFTEVKLKALSAGTFATGTADISLYWGATLIETQTVWDGDTVSIGDTNSATFFRPGSEYATPEKLRFTVTTSDGIEIALNGICQDVLMT